MKRFVCAMCAMTLLLFGAMPTALAAAAPSPSAQTAESEDSTPAPSTEDLPTLPIPEPDPVPLYPAEVKQSEENGITRIEKIYYRNLCHRWQWRNLHPPASYRQLYCD